MRKVTEPFPVPDPLPTRIIQGSSSGATLHAHPLGLTVIEMVMVPPFAPMFTTGEENVMVQVAAAWVTTKLCPATESVAVRCDVV